MRLCSLAAAATRGVGDAVARADLNTRLGVGSGLRAHALLDLSRHGQESLLDVGGVLGGGLKERDVERVRELLHEAYAISLLNRREMAEWRNSDLARKRRANQISVVRTLATVYSTTFLSDISLLLPTSSLLTPSVA